MARQHAPSQLEDKYARLLGAMMILDHEIEPVVGIAAIIEKSMELHRRRKKMQAEGMALVTAIRAFEPDFDHEKVKPIVTRLVQRKKGEGAKAAYRVLKSATEPLTIWQIGHRIAAELKIAEPDHREMCRMAAMANGAMQRSLKRGLVVKHEGKPARWSIKPREGAAASIRRSGMAAPSAPLGPTGS